MSERKAWTQEQDQALRQLFEERGITKWSQIANMMLTHFHIQGRNGKQCRQRYHNHLSLTIRHDQWTRQEEQCLCELHNAMGNRWAEIARAIPGRSENCVKNKFYSMVRRGLKQLNITIRSSIKRYKELDIAVINKIVEMCELNYKKQDKNHKITEAMEMKKAILSCGLRDRQDNEDQFATIKALIDRIKDFSRTVAMNKKKDRHLSYSKHNGSEDFSLQIQEEEYRDKYSVKQPPVLQKLVSIKAEPHFQLDQQLGFDHSHEQNQLLPELRMPLSMFPSFHRNISLLSNKSIADLSNQPHHPELISRDSLIKSSFEFCELDNVRSPRPTILFDSPYFDQLRGNNFSSWAQFYPH